MTSYLAVFSETRKPCRYWVAAGRVSGICVLLEIVKELKKRITSSSWRPADEGEVAISM